MNCETRLWSIAGVLSLLWLFYTHAVSHCTVVLQTVDPNVTENTNDAGVTKQPRQNLRQETF